MTREMNEIGIAIKLHNLLANNIVSFTFRKVNGELRHALGTRNLTLAEIHTNTTIPTPQGAEQPNSYYDVEKMGWRSYKPENLISIDTIWDASCFTARAEQTKKGTLPKREIPISKPMGGGADINKIIGGLFGGMGVPMGEIRKSMDDLDKDIDIVPPTASFGGANVGVPTATERGIALPLGEIGVEDFAKMVAHYVVEEFINRLK